MTVRPLTLMSAHLIFAKLEIRSLMQGKEASGMQMHSTMPGKNSSMGSKDVKVNFGTVSGWFMWARGQKGFDAAGPGG